MKNKLFLVLAILALSLTVRASAEKVNTPLPEVIRDPDKISLDLKGMDIVGALKIVATRAGMNIAVGKNVTGKVTLFLKDADVHDAFEIMLLSNELAYEKKGNIVNIMTQREYELKYGQRYEDKKEARILQLNYARAAELSKALNQIKTAAGKIVVDESSNTIALIETKQKIKELEEFIKNADLPTQTRVFNLNYALSDKIQPKIRSFPEFCAINFDNLLLC